MNECVYIHEFIDIIGHNRANYMHHITANWSPIGQKERNQLCFGVFGTVGSTRIWPEVVNIWEHTSWDGLADAFDHEFSHPTLQDPALAEWWAEAANFRSRGVDRILVAAPWTRSIEQLCADGVTGVTYAHELVTLPVGTIGRYAADLSAKVLLVMIVAEFAMLIVLDILILSHSGLSALPLEVFSPKQVFSGSVGPALMIAFTSFIGIESAVIYANEARNPGKTVPRAIYLCVGVISVFYFLTVWLIVGSVGVDQIVPVTEKAQGDLLFTLSGEQGGTILTTLMQIFFLTSVLASLVALHNATTRYLQTMGTQGTMPRFLGALHPKYQGPARASEALSVLTAVLVAAFVILGADPYLGVYTSLGGLFTVGIVAMQGAVAVTVVVFFRKRKDRRLWKTLIAPAIGAIGLLTATALIIANYSVLTGTEDTLPNLMPWSIPLAFVIGLVVYHRRRDVVVDFDPVPAPTDRAQA